MPKREEKNSIDNDGAHYSFVFAFEKCRSFWINTKISVVPSVSFYFRKNSKNLRALFNNLIVSPNSILDFDNYGNLKEIQTFWHSEFPIENPSLGFLKGMDQVHEASGLHSKQLWTLREIKEQLDFFIDIYALKLSADEPSPTSSKKTQASESLGNERDKTSTFGARRHDVTRGVMADTTSTDDSAHSSFVKKNT